MTTRKLRFHPAVDDEVLDQATHYEEKAGLGTAFIEASDRVLARIARAPYEFAKYEHAPLVEEIRQATFERFPCSVFFHVLSDEEIFVLAITGQRIRPGHWASRSESL